MMDIENIELLQQNDSTFSLVGELGFTNVAVIYERGLAQFNSYKEIIVDLSRLERIDSAGIAMLIAWLKAAKRHQKTLHYRQPSTQVQTLARVCGLDGLLLA